MCGAIVGSWAGMRGVVTLAAAPHPARGDPPSRRAGGDRPRRDRGHSPPPGHDAPGACPRSTCAARTPARTPCRRRRCSARRRARCGSSSRTRRRPGGGAGHPAAGAAGVNRSWEARHAGSGRRRPQRDPGQAALRDDPGGAGRAAPHPRPRRADHAVLNAVLGQLDAEETALVWSDRSEQYTALRCDRRSHRRCLRAPRRRRGPAPAHECRRLLRRAWIRGCAGCTCAPAPPAETWGCCDSSEGNHASAHFKETGHPVMRSIEPGEAWRWCFVDEVIG